MPRGTEQKRQRAQPGKVKARRASYDLSFKTHVVETALQRPANNRIKPTCALFPGIEPCQVRQLPGDLPPFFRAARAAPLAPYGPPRRAIFLFEGIQVLLNSHGHSTRLRPDIACPSPSP